LRNRFVEISLAGAHALESHLRAVVIIIIVENDLLTNHAGKHEEECGESQELKFSLQ
jgi:hypothetical protein